MILALIVLDDSKLVEIMSENYIVNHKRIVALLHMPNCCITF
jgi:hypothetical protein